nr:hypothetical protein [Ardenticatenales bacterium]
LLLCLLAPIALYTRHNVPIHPHYFIVLYPAAYLAVGGLVAATHRRWPRLGQALALCVSLVAVVQLVVFASLLRFVAEQNTPGGLGTPLRYWEEAAARIREVSVCEVKVIGEGTWPEYHAMPAIFDTRLCDRRGRGQE